MNVVLHLPVRITSYDQPAPHVVGVLIQVRHRTRRHLLEHQDVTYHRYLESDDRWFVLCFKGDAQRIAGVAPGALYDAAGVHNISERFMLCLTHFICRTIVVIHIRPAPWVVAERTSACEIDRVFAGRTCRDCMSDHSTYVQ